MKKLIIIIMLLFSINVVKAESLDISLTPYFVRLYKNGVDTTIRVLKYYESGTNNYVFNIDPEYYDVGGIFTKNNEDNANTYGRYHKKLGLFNSIVYHTFNSKKTDKTYLYTQMIIWNLISGYDVTAVDSSTNELIDLTNEYRYYWTKVFNYHNFNSFDGKEYTINLGDTLTLKYDKYKEILDNPDIDGLKFTNEDNFIYINGIKPGSYNITLTKNNEQINYVYKNDNSYYWQSLGGPGNISSSFKINVIGTKLKINENLVGVNEKFGDANINESNYEIYLNDTLYTTTNNLLDIDLIPNKTYTIKDISNNIGYSKNKDIVVKLLDSDYNLTIDKYVISKKINTNILDSYSYEIYLKSNDEFYGVINANTKDIILPYGLYYIKSNDINYYKEIDILNDITDTLVIDNNIKEDVKDEIINSEIKEENNNKPILEDNSKEDIILNESLDNRIEHETITNQKNEEIINDLDNIKKENTVVNELSNIENPKTIDNIYFYIITLLIGVFILLLVIKIIKRIKN